MTFKRLVSFLTKFIAGSLELGKEWAIGCMVFVMLGLILNVVGMFCDGAFYQNS